MSSYSRDAGQVRQRAADRVREAQQRIQDAVARLQSGEQWREFLRLQSRLHAYSANNTLLIAMAHRAAWERGDVPTPYPSLVAGFRTWKSLGRSVEKGQRGYPVLAPNRHWRHVAVDATGCERRIGRGESPGPGERIERRRVVAGFRLAHVFAVEQTAGAPVAAPPSPTVLQGQAPAGLWEAITGQVQARGFSVQLAASAAELDGANGVTLFDSRTVLVRADMDPAARVKTLTHELAHVMLHHPDTIAAEYADRPRPSRAAMEVEAESVAFIVADAHGLATDAYSFPYVSTWAGADGVKVVQASASRVAAAARQVVEASQAAHTAGGRLPAVDRTTDRQPPSITWSADPGPTAPVTGPEVA